MWFTTMINHNFELGLTKTLFMIYDVSCLNAKICKFKTTLGSLSLMFRYIIYLLFCIIINN